MPVLPVEGAVAALRQARIARPSESAAFSLIHRRFHEYFLIHHFRRNPDKLLLDSIVSDARWREGLVLFCEVADAPVAQQIAEFCWAQICNAQDPVGDIGSDAYRHALHSLRFLGAAFRTRRDLIASFAPALAELIENNARNPDILMAKHALEAAGVLSDDAAQQTIAAALSSANSWLIETAFRACRYLPAPSRRTRLLAMDRLLDIPPVVHLKTYREIMFSLRLIEGMHGALWLYRLRHLEIALLFVWFGFLLLFLRAFDAIVIVILL